MFVESSIRTIVAAHYVCSGSCTFPCSQTSSPRGQSPKCMGCIVEPMGRVNEPYSCWMPRGMIRWSYVSPVGINPGADGILNALEALQTKETFQ